MPFLHGPSTPCYLQCIVNPKPTIIPSYLAIQAGCNHIPISFVIKVFTKTRQAPNERNAYPKPSQTNYANHEYNPRLPSTRLMLPRHQISSFEREKRKSYICISNIKDSVISSSS
jgi:hypothetical protein